MAQIKKLSTELQVKDKLLDTSGDAGTSGQILSSTGTGTNWINATTFSGGTVANATTFSSTTTFSSMPVLNADILVNGHVYGRSVNNESSRLYRFGGLYLTWDSDSYGLNDHHSLRSTYGNSFTDSITLNSFNHIRFNIDSNDNNSTSYFEVGDGTTSTSNVIFRIDQAGDVTITGDSTTSGDFTIADNKALMLGTGGDAFFKHTGSAFSFFNDTGHVTFTQRVTDGNIIFKSDNMSGGETEYFRVDGAAGETIFSRNTQHLDSVYAQFGAGDDLKLFHNGTDSFIINETGNLKITQGADDKDIIFESDDGSGSTTQYFRVDGSSQKIIYSKNQWLYDNIRAVFGSSDDLSIFHNGSNSYLENTTGDLFLVNYADNKRISFYSDSGTGGTALYFYLDGERSDGTNVATRFPDGSIILLGSGTGWNDGSQIYHNGTNFYLNEYVGDMNFTVHTNDGDIIFNSDDGSGNVTQYLRIDGGARSLVVSAAMGMYFNDGIAARFGTGTDLIIYHDGSNSYIQDTGSGGLRISSDLFRVYNADLSGLMINAVPDDRVELYFNDNKKFETTSTGATVTGSLSVTGDLNITGDINSVSVTDLDVVDKTITLGKGQDEGHSDGSGIIVDGSGASILWDEPNNEWEVNKDLSIYTGAGIATLIVGRNSNERLIIDQTDNETVLTADNDSDGNSEHNFRLNRTFEGSGANNFKIQKGGTDQLTIDTNANATFAGDITAEGGDITVKDTGTENAYFRAYATGTGAAGIYIDASNGDGSGSDYFSLRQLNDLSVEFDVRGNAGNTIFKSKGVTNLTMDGANSTFAGNITVDGSNNSFDTGNNGTFVTNDANNYPRITVQSASAQLGLFRSNNNVGGMYIGGASDGFRIWTESFSPKFHLDQSGNGTFSGTVTTGGDLTIGGTGGIFIPENIYHTGDTNSYFGFSANDTIEIVTAGTQKITADSNAAYLRYQGAAKLSTTSGGVSVTGLQVTSDNNFYRETINSNTGGESWNASNGWHRIIEISGGSGRGKCHFLIQTGGGSGTPCRVEAIVNTAWSNSNSTLTIIHNSYPNFITDIRVVRNGTSNKSFVDIKGTGDDYVDVTILPDGSTSAALVNFTNVNTLPSNDTMEIHQTLTNMIMSMSSGQGSGNGYDGNAGTGQKPFQVKYDGSIYAEQGHFEDNVTVGHDLKMPTNGEIDWNAGDVKLVGTANDIKLQGGSLSITGDGSNAVTLTESGSGDFTIDAADDIRLDAGGGDIVLRTNGSEHARLTDNNPGLNISTSETNSSIYLSPNGTGNVYALTDTFIVTAAESETAKILLRTDESDDNGDDWYITNELNNDLTFKNDRTGSQLANLTITPQSPSSSSIATFAGNVTVTNNLTANLLYTDFVQTRNGTKIDFRHQDGSVIMMVDTDDARVGIGTTSPGYKLEIADDTDSTANLLMLRNSDSTYAQTWAFQSDTAKDLVITGSSGAGGFKFVPGSRGSTFVGDVITSGNIYLNNNKTIFGKNTSGSNYGLLTITSGNVVKLGAYAYTSAATQIGLGDNGKFLIGTEEALSINNSKNATFAGDINMSTGKSVYISGTSGLRLIHDGTNGHVISGTGQLKITNSDQDEDIIFRGNDNGSSFTALTLDMSEAGYATFNSTVKAPTLTGANNLGATVYTIDATGVVLHATGSVVRAGTGTKGDPTFSFTGDTNTGMFSDSADTLKFTAGGASMLHVNVNAGKVDVVGNLTVSSNIEDRNIPCLFNSNFEDAYGTSIVVVPFNNNTENNVSSRTYNHNLTMPYAGKLTKIVMKNVSGTLSSGFTTQLFLYVNGSQQASSSEISLSSSSVTWTPTTNNTFSAGDVLSFAYQKSAIKTFGGVSFGVAIELTDYDI